MLRAASSPPSVGSQAAGTFNYLQKQRTQITSFFLCPKIGRSRRLSFLVEENGSNQSQDTPGSRLLECGMRTPIRIWDSRR
jgi:hypothetical protein